jgi:hypothetical protein
MIQTTIVDITKPCSVAYRPPSHEAGERWPGPEKPTRQLTLFDKRLVRAAVVGVKCREASTIAREESDDESWFVKGS